MNIKRAKKIILFSSIGLGLLISFTMKSNLETYAPVTITSLEATQKEIKAISSEVNDLKNEYKEKTDELNTLKEISFTDNSIVDKLNSDLILNKSTSGDLALEGPGISIKMYDNPTEDIVGDINDYIIHDVDVLNILNDLRVAGAEAISINGERVVTSSELKCGGPIIRINGVSVGTPFIIRAIGDRKLLMAAVNAPGTYGDALKNIYSIGFEPEEEDALFIPAYAGNFSFKYAEPKEDDK